MFLFSYKIKIYENTTIINIKNVSIPKTLIMIDIIYINIKINNKSNIVFTGNCKKTINQFLK